MVMILVYNTSPSLDQGTFNYKSKTMYAMTEIVTVILPDQHTEHCLPVVVFDFKVHYGTYSCYCS